jgi:hypothetical protein
MEKIKANWDTYLSKECDSTCPLSNSVQINQFLVAERLGKKLTGAMWLVDVSVFAKSVEQRNKIKSANGMIPLFSAEIQVVSRSLCTSVGTYKKDAYVGAQVIGIAAGDPFEQ